MKSVYTTRCATPEELRALLVKIGWDTFGAPEQWLVNGECAVIYTEDHTSTWLVARDANETDDDYTARIEAVAERTAVG